MAMVEGNRPGWWRPGLGVVLSVVLVGGGIALWRGGSESTAPVAERAPVRPVVRAVVALGRLEPEGEVISLAPPVLGGEAARVERLLVEEGERVRRGQVVAVLDRFDRLVAERAQAAARVAIAGARLARVRAGAKAGELAAQRAMIARLSAEMEIAETEFARYRGLEAEGAISASLLDSKRVVVATLRGQLNAAREQLTALAEVRPTDVRLAEAELADARAELGRVETDLARSFVRSPLDGQVLQVHARAGEQVGPAGVVELGHTEAMEAVAEVYEDDLARVRIGQRARVRGVNRAFAGELHGTVVRITPRIGKKDVLASDPAADVDARVAEVRVRLDRQDGVRVRGLTNLKIQVEIDG